MKLDIDKVISEMTASIKSEAKNNWSKIQPVTKSFFQKRKQRLELLSELRLNGDLSEAQFQSRLEDEKLIAEAELNAVAVLSKSMAQKAANAAFEVLEKVIQTILRNTLQ